MDRGRGGVRNTTHDAVVVVEGDAFASLDIQTSRARVRKDNSHQSRSVLILDDDADPSFGGNGGNKGGRSRCANNNFGVVKTTEEGRGE